MRRSGTLWKRTRSDSITRDEWAKVLRKHVGVSHEIASDDDLDAIFDAMDRDGSNTVTLKEFSAFHRGAATSTHSRGCALARNMLKGGKKKRKKSEAGAVVEKEAAAAVASVDG